MRYQHEEIYMPDAEVPQHQNSFHIRDSKLVHFFNFKFLCIARLLTVEPSPWFTAGFRLPVTATLQHFITKNMNNNLLRLPGLFLIHFPTTSSQMILGHCLLWNFPVWQESFHTSVTKWVEVNWNEVGANIKNKVLYLCYFHIFISKCRHYKKTFLNLLIWPGPQRSTLNLPIFSLISIYLNYVKLCSFCLWDAASKSVALLLLEELQTGGFSGSGRPKTPHCWKLCSIK